MCRCQDDENHANFWQQLQGNTAGPGATDSATPNNALPRNSNQNNSQRNNQNNTQRNNNNAVNQSR